MLVRTQRHGITSALLVGRWNGMTTLDNHSEVSLKTYPHHWAAWPNNCRPGRYPRETITRFSHTFVQERLWYLYLSSPNLFFDDCNTLWYIHTTILSNERGPAMDSSQPWCQVRPGKIPREFSWVRKSQAKNGSILDDAFYVTFLTKENSRNA